MNGKPMKLENQFTYLSSNISSTESDDKMHVSLWKSNLSDKIKLKFF